MKMNEVYEAPVLEVLNVMIETGFAGSEPGFENPDVPQGGDGGSGGF